MQSHDGMGPQHDFGITPAEHDVGMVAFGIGQNAYFIDEGQCRGEIAEREAAGLLRLHGFRFGIGDGMLEQLHADGTFRAL